MSGSQICGLKSGVLYWGSYAGTIILCMFLFVSAVNCVDQRYEQVQNYIFPLLFENQDRWFPEIECAGNWCHEMYL